MADLEKRIANNLKESIKNKDGLRTSTLRMLTASLQNLAIEKQQKELADADVLKVINKQVKQHQDSIESFKNGGRHDLAEKEAKELEILRSYLPKQLDDKEIEKIIKGVISEIGGVSKSDFGKVMKLSMEKLRGSTDGKVISSIVQRLLSG